MIAGAFLLDFFKTKGFVLVGFSIIFFIACIFRLLSSDMLRRHYEPRMKLKKNYYFDILQFIKRAPKTNFGKFAIYISMISLAVAIAGPFFAVYMLKELNFSYTTFMCVNIAASISSILFFPLLGKFSDKYGNRELLKVGSVLIMFLPILWIFSASPIYLAFVPQLLGRFGWAGFHLSASNFIYDSVKPQNRGLCVAYYNILNGVGVFVGALIGGLLIHYVSINFINKFFFIFLISGILRIASVLIMIPKLNEVRDVKTPKSNPLLYFKGIKPMKGLIFGIFSGIFGKGIKKQKA